MHFYKLRNTKQQLYTLYYYCIDCFFVFDNGRGVIISIKLAKKANFALLIFLMFALTMGSCSADKDDIESGSEEPVQASMNLPGFLSITAIAGFVLSLFILKRELN